MRSLQIIPSLRLASLEIIGHQSMAILDILLTFFFTSICQCWPLSHWYAWSRALSRGYEGFHDWQKLWDENQQRYCCSAYQRACQDETEFVVHKVYEPVRVPSVPRVHYVPVPSPPHVVYRTRVHYLKPKVIYKKSRDVFTYDCHEGYPNWFFG